MNNDLWAEKELPDELHDIFADIAGHCMTRFHPPKLQTILNQLQSSYWKG
jgi:hypothetical protein